MKWEEVKIRWKVNSSISREMNDFRFFLFGFFLLSPPIQSLSHTFSLSLSLFATFHLGFLLHSEKKDVLYWTIFPFHTHNTSEILYMKKSARLMVKAWPERWTHTNVECARLAVLRAANVSDDDFKHEIKLSTKTFQIWEFSLNFSWFIDFLFVVY